MVLRPTTMSESARRAQVTNGLDAAFRRIRAEAEVREDFPDAVLDAAGRAASDPLLPDRDARDVPFVTIDPPGSMDLDQALHLEQNGNGFRVRYAIADVAAFVEPGGPIDTEARLRGQTVYCPDVRVPLHPSVLSEAGASLLPGQDRPAYVWEIRLDADGARTSATVHRAMVRSRRRCTYAEVQAALDAGTDDELLTALRDVGRLRIERESARGGASLPMPEQEVHVDDGGHYRLRLRPVRPAEEWNAQVSLLTGMAAARIMLDGGVGILRTMPAATPEAVARFRHQAHALDAHWPTTMAYGDFLRTLDRENPRHLALIHDATALFRGSGYEAFDTSAGTPPPEEPVQAAIAAPYTHTTAPLRRLVDRFSLAICEALVDDRPVPDWARDGIGALPGIMGSTGQRARTVDRKCTDAVEAAALAHRVGEVFDAVVVDTNRDGVDVQLIDPVVSARADGEAHPGDRVRVELAQADVAEHTVRFTVRP